MNTLSIYTSHIYLILILILFFLPTKRIWSQYPALTQKLDSYFQEVKKQSPAPGFSVVVVKNREVVFSKGYGLERADKSIPMTAQTVSAIGSLTKSFTALAMMQLVEQGKMKLDEPITTYLPEFTTANSERSKKITVRMLLNNSSGIYGGVTQKWQNMDTALEQLMHSLEGFYIKKEPGTSYEYSNTAFSLAGLIVQRVSGLSYEKYITKYILEPLEMRHSSTDPNDFEGLKALEGHNFGIKRSIPATTGFDSYEMIPAGSMFRSSAVDLGHYLIALLNGGHFKGQQIIRPESIQELWKSQTAFPGLTVDMGGDGQAYHYGLGWMISEVEGRTLIHHGGSTGTMSSMTVLYPKKELAASILFNVDYNFLDPYQCPSEFSMMNNLFHLLEGEEMSDFGNPRIHDPSINSYMLPTSLHQRYIGSYMFNGKGDKRHYYGVKLVISSHSEGKLIGETYRGKQLLSEFELDFVNEGLAVSRNIGSPLNIRFKIQPDGRIDGLYLADSDFRKLPEDYEARFQWIQFKDKKRGFYLPNDWQWKEKNGFISAYKQNTNAMLIAGFIVNQNGALNAHVSQHFPSHQITYSGTQHTEVRGKQAWLSQSFASQKGEQSFQHYMMTNPSDGFFIILTTPFGRLTVELMNDLVISL